MTTPAAWTGAVEIPVEHIIPDDLNPNMQDKATLDRLTEMIRQHGFDEPVQVTPRGGPGQDGIQRYDLIGGEHRWIAAKRLAMKTIPAVVKPPMDEAERRMLMVQRNMVRGDLDRAKFTKLVASLEARTHLQRQAIAEKMGLDSKRAAILLADRAKKDKATVEEAVTKSRGKLVIADNVAHVLRDVLSKQGDRIADGWVFFAHGGKIHLMLQTDDECHKAVQVLCAWAERQKETLNRVVATAIRNELQKWGVDVDTFELPPDYVPSAGTGEDGE
jgi:ParB/RepB/Spo0J family partition protein